MSKTLSKVELAQPDLSKALAGRVLDGIAAWIIRRALRRAEAALRNDRVFRKRYGEFDPNASEDLCVFLGLRIALSSDPSSQESIQC